MNILTIDLEDWFHILDHDETALPEQWNKFESRVEENTDLILDQLSSRNIYATFFCLGWIAKKFPFLIRKISELGHELGCHSMDHQLVYRQSAAQFKSDLRDSMEVLEQATGKKVRS